MADGRRLYLLAEGRLVNLAAAEGHPAAVMDMSFANQALSVEYALAAPGSLERKVHVVPREIDDEIARLKLESLAIEIDHAERGAGALPGLLGPGHVRALHHGGRVRHPALADHRLRAEAARPRGEPPGPRAPARAAAGGGGARGGDQPAPPRRRRARRRSATAAGSVSRSAGRTSPSCSAPPAAPARSPTSCASRASRSWCSPATACTRSTSERSCAGTATPRAVGTLTVLEIDDPSRFGVCVARRGRADRRVPGEAAARRGALAPRLLRRLLLRAARARPAARPDASTTGRTTCCPRCSPTAIGSPPTAPTRTGATSARSPTSCARTSTASPGRSGSAPPRASTRRP